MRVLWIDRILELHAERRLVAQLDLPPGDDTFALHFPRRPLLPASALLEAWAQAATFLIEPSLGFGRKALPGYVNRARFYRPVEPGPVLDLVVCVEQWSAEGAVLTGSAHQEGERRATCTLGMLTAPMDDFYGPEHRPALRAMYARLLAGAVLEGFARDPLETFDHAHA